MIMGFLRHDSPRTLVSQSPNIVQKFEGGHTREPVEWVGSENFVKIRLRYISEGVHRSVIVSIIHE